MPDPYSTFGLSCPGGGSFYICQKKKVEFIGCCTTNPCDDDSRSCPQANLRNASFSADSYEGIKPQDCVEETALWYTCKFNNPPFVGCCASNPCASGACPAGDLVPAKLSADPDLRIVFLTTASNSTASHGSEDTGATSGSGTLPPLADGTSIRLSAGAIVGISLGIAFLVIVLIGGCVFMFKRGWHASKREERGSATPFLGPPPSGRFTSPLSSPPFTPYRDSQINTSTGHMLGLASPLLFCARSPAQSNHPFSPYNGSTLGNARMCVCTNHLRSSSYVSELGPRTPRMLELETEHNSQEYARHELAAESGSPTSRSRGPTQPKELPRTPPPSTSIPRGLNLDDNKPRTPLRPPAPRSRKSSMNKELPKTPPRTPPPVAVSPETSPILVSRFSASRRSAVNGLNIVDSPAVLFAGSRRGRHSTPLLSPETPGRRSGTSVYIDYNSAQQ